MGGLADWFAVTAIFRHPLGIPIPHTAIVPSQKDRIGRTLGDFLKNHFLTRDIIAAEVRRLGLSERAAHWLREPENSRKLAGQLAGGLAKAIQALPEREVRELIQRNALERVQKTSVAPIMANLLAVVTSENRHHELLDEILDMMSKAVAEHRDAIKGRLKRESPWWIPAPVDQAISKQLLAALEGSVAEVRRNAFHPLRKRFDEAVSQFIERLRSSPEVAARADALKDQFLNSAVVEEFVAGLWDSIRNSAARYASDPEHKEPGDPGRGDHLSWRLAPQQRGAAVRAGRVPHRPDRERGREAPGSDRGPGRAHGGRVGSGRGGEAAGAGGGERPAIHPHQRNAGRRTGRTDTSRVEDGALTAIENCPLPIDK